MFEICLTAKWGAVAYSFFFFISLVQFAYQGRKKCRMTVTVSSDWRQQNWYLLLFSSSSCLGDERGCFFYPPPRFCFLLVGWRRSPSQDASRQNRFQDENRLLPRGNRHRLQVRCLYRYMSKLTFLGGKLEYCFTYLHIAVKETWTLKYQHSCIQHFSIVKKC